MPQIISSPKNQNYKQRPIITTCNHCFYTISYTKDEIERLNNEFLGIYCPNCGKIIKIKDIIPFTFPDTFQYYSSNNIENNKEIKKYIEEIKFDFSKMNFNDYKIIENNGTLIIGFKQTRNNIIKKNIIVCKNYWSESIFEDCK